MIEKKKETLVRETAEKFQYGTKRLFFLQKFNFILIFNCCKFNSEPKIQKHKNC